MGKEESREIQEHIMQSKKVKLKMNSPEFEAIVKDAIKGDKEALSNLCNIIARDVLYMATTLLSNSEDAEDLSQEVLYEICKSIKKLREPKAFKTWMSGILINKKNNFLTENTKRGTVLDLNEYIESLTEEREEFIPAVSLDNGELRRVIRELIKKLPERQREAIILRHFDGFSVTEVADIMGIAQPNASKYLALAGRKIKFELERYLLSEKSKDGDIKAHAVMPLGLVLSEVLQQEALLFGLANEAAIQSILAKCGEFIAAGVAEAALATAATAETVAAATATTAAETAAIATTSAATVGTAGVATSAVLTSTAAIAAICGVIITAAVGLSAFMSGILERTEPLPPLTATVELHGGVDNGEEIIHLNPERASVDSQNMEPLYWWVTQIGSEVVILEGQGNAAEDIMTKLAETGIYYGEFMIYFRLESQQHEHHTTGRNFYITTEN